MVTCKLGPRVTAESAAPSEPSSGDCEQRAEVCRAKPPPNTLTAVTRTLTGHVCKLMFGGRQSISRLQRRKTMMMSLVFKDARMTLLKIKLSRKVVRYGNIQFCPVSCLPSRKLLKRRVRVLKRRSRRAIACRRGDVQELRRALSTELDAAANLSTAAQDSRTAPHSLDSKSDDIDTIFSAIL